MLVPAIAIVAAGLLSYGIAVQEPATAAGTSNDVIRGGYSNPSQLASKTSSSSELRALFNHDFVSGYGIGDPNNFKKNAKSATVYKDGRVVLGDGTTIATNAYSLGREKIQGNRIATPKIGGTTWYYGPTRENFASNSLKAYVLLNPLDHSMQFAALTACGNPVWGKSPGYYCDQLKMEKKSNTTYTFWSVPYIKNGAKVKKVVYDFGDGKTRTETNPNTKVTHTYSKPGDYEAKVTVYFDVNGKEKKHTRSQCTKKITVKEEKKPYYVCEDLVVNRIGRLEDMTYDFAVETKEGDGATFKEVVYHFGDGKTATRQNKEPVSHTYSDYGKYDAYADVYFNVGNDVQSKRCKETVMFEKELKPAFACTSLTFEPIAENKYRFTVKGESQDTTFKSAMFDFGDGQTAEGLEATGEETVTTDHQYAKADTYTVKAYLTYEHGTTEETKACIVEIPVEEKPEVPEKPEKPQEEAPQVLPSTGPGQIVGGALGLGSLAGATLYYRNSRRNLLSQILNKR